jgi:hypothetical protein
VAPGDRHDKPETEVQESVEGFILMRTERNGWIGLTTDGEQMWVEVEKKRGGCRVSDGVYAQQSS